MRMKSVASILLGPLTALIFVLPLNLSLAGSASEFGEARKAHSSRSVTAPLADFTVTNLNDSGLGSLRQAIADANAVPGPAAITFSVTGAITLTTGRLLITDDLIINGPGAANLTVSGNNASRVFEIAFTTVTITDLTISNARVGDFDFGGAISNGGSTLTVTNCVLSGNFADEGGAIWNGGGTVTINTSTLSGNAAAVGASGAGGAIYNIFGTMTINNSVLSDNSITVGIFGAGGGLYNTEGTVTISNSTLSNNFGNVSGGGIYSASGMVTIANSTISNNVAEVGGGILNSATLTITNSTISNNSGTTAGGGIYSGGSLMIANTTISNNSAGVGGGIFSDGPGNIKNSIVATSTSGGDCAGGTPLTASGVNFSTGNSCPDFTQVPATGPGGLNLGPLQNNGGPTKTNALLSGSVAIDAVTDCTDVMLNPVTLDQRGVARPIDGNGDGASRCDVGAYEAPEPFDLCIQDDSSGYILKIKSTTGEYEFANCSGFTIGGVGSLVAKGSILTLQHYAADRRVLARIDASVNKGTASIQIFERGTTYTIADRNTSNNVCACANR